MREPSPSPIPAHYPTGYRDPTTPDAADRWLGTGAEVLVDTRADVTGDRVAVEARVWDLKSRKLILGRKYSGGATYVDRIAHTLANDLVKYFTGKNGLFLSTILCVVEQPGGGKEIGAMDFDGRNPRLLTSHKSIAISPTAGGGKIAYTSYVRLFPQIWTMAPDGSDKREVATGVELNASPSLTADGSQIAFAGSAKGNTDIYTIAAGGGAAHRLTTSRALEASPGVVPDGPPDPVHLGPDRHAADLRHGRGRNRLAAADPRRQLERRRLLVARRGEDRVRVPQRRRLQHLRHGPRLGANHPGHLRRIQRAPDAGRPTARRSCTRPRRNGSTQIYTVDANGQNRQTAHAGKQSPPAVLGAVAETRGGIGVFAASLLY